MRRASLRGSASVFAWVLVLACQPRTPKVEAISQPAAHPPPEPEPEPPPPSTALAPESPPLFRPAWPVLGGTWAGGGYLLAVQWPMERSLLTASTGDHLRGLDPTTGAIVTRYRTARSFQPTDPMPFAAAPDGRHVAAVASDDEGVRLFELATGAPTGRPPAKKISANRLTWSPDGARIAAFEGNVIHLWTLATGDVATWGLATEDNRASLLGHVTDVSWSPDGARLAVTHDAGDAWEGDEGRASLTVFDTDSRPLATRRLPLAEAVAWAGERIVVAGSDLVALGAADLAPIWRHEVRGCVVRASPNGTRVAVVDDLYAKLRILDAADGRELGTSRVVPCPHLAWSPDGRALASARGTALEIFEVTPDGQLRERGEPHHTHAVESLSASADGRRLVSVGANGDVLAWDLPDGPPRRAGWAMNGFLGDMDIDSGEPRYFAMDGAASLSGDDVLTVVPVIEGNGAIIELRRWGESEPRVRRQVPEHPRELARRAGDVLVVRSRRKVHTVAERTDTLAMALPRALSHDGARVVEVWKKDLDPRTADVTFGDEVEPDTRIEIRAVPGGKLQTRLDLPANANACVFSADDREVACVGEGWLAVADAATGKRRMRVEPDRRASSRAQLALSAGLVAALSQGHVLVYDVASGARRAEHRWRDPKISAVALTTLSGRPTLVLGDSEGKIHLIPIGPAPTSEPR